MLFWMNGLQVLALVVFPLAVPNIVTQLLVGGLCLELGLSGVKARRVLHHSRHGARYGRELVEACQLIRTVRRRTFATDLGVLAVVLCSEAVRHTTFL